MRLCIDYRKLDDVTRKDAFPLLRCENLLNAAGKETPRFITKLDLKTGFHQVLLSADASRKTAFVTPDGQYQYRTMPYGLTCAPAVFQQLMAKILHGLSTEYVFWHINDILIVTPTFELHMKVLQMVFDRLRQRDMILKSSKCKILRAEHDARPSPHVYARGTCLEKVNDCLQRGRSEAHHAAVKQKEYACEHEVPV